MPSVALLPVSSPTMVMVGTAGGVVSIVTQFMLLGEVLPATSVAVKLNTCVPSDSVPVLGKVQLPLPSAVTVPISVPLSKIFTVLPASAMPVRARSLSLVVSSKALNPVSREILIRFGAPGTAVSTVNAMALLAWLVPKPGWVSLAV